jgi:hypothetical protein
VIHAGGEQRPDKLYTLSRCQDFRQVLQPVAWATSLMITLSGLRTCCTFACLLDCMPTSEKYRPVAFLLQPDMDRHG